MILGDSHSSVLCSVCTVTLTVQTAARSSARRSDRKQGAAGPGAPLHLSSLLRCSLQGQGRAVSDGTLYRRTARLGSNSNGRRLGVEFKFVLGLASHWSELGIYTLAHLRNLGARRSKH